MILGFWAIFWGVCALTTAVICWSQRSFAPKIVALFLVINWIAWNFIKVIYGVDVLLERYPIIELSMVVAMSVIWWKSGGAWLFLCIAIGCVMLAGYFAYQVSIYYSETVDLYTFFATLNVLYGGQLALTAWAGGRRLVRDYNSGRLSIFRRSHHQRYDGEEE